ncbi:hypothetical protein Ngar_c19480 [Candidatus Nitrososphaera gargensis Ga9.2]|uniref:Uncharacterized protein n=1 Tax=Nitrososphaera gargensis (strain Ga9.2) TaxID=1237085 RepID=K0IGF1_NITGG|nr:hypothetical protein [Candidatus Nitrososphaera gargensis]AFU58880.1 hypothetical protein Ngar_c19480 [Candidatus Nitrososphaera gargensis Ga9.2]
MEKELIDEVRARLHAMIDAAIDEYSAKLNKSAGQQIPTPDGLDIDKLPWQKSKHGQYEYLFPSQVPDNLKTALKNGKAQIRDCILYLTKQGSVRRYRITSNKQTANSSAASAGGGGDVKR